MYVPKNGTIPGKGSKAQVTAKSINETLLQIRNKIYRKEAELMERG